MPLLVRGPGPRKGKVKGGFHILTYWECMVACHDRSENQLACKVLA